MQTINDVPMLLRREIEARMAAPLIRAFEKELGQERTHQIVSEVIRDLALAAGQDLASRVEVNDIDQFMEHLLPVFQSGGALEMEVKEHTSCEARWDTTRCKYAEMYRELGMADLGKLLSCNRDEFLFRGYNPDMVFERTMTKMDGDRCCDFCLKLQRPTEKE